MTRGRARRHRTLLVVIISFFAGVFVDGWLRTHGPPLPAVGAAPAPSSDDSPAEAGHDKSPPASDRRQSSRGSGTLRTVEPAVGAATATTGSIPSRLRVPIDGADVSTWKGAFEERRGGGSRGHEAVDILAPRNTSIHAVVNGTIAKIFESKAGGHTIYETDRDGRLCYYYAHLERYADGLHEGQSVSQGDVIGYVGTSGNAPKDTPHLHFAVFELNEQKQWWNGRPIDPYLVFTEAAATSR